MKQLTQKLKDGNMQVMEVPEPVLRSGCILIQNYYSLISAGTEGSTVKTARTGLIGKAKERPQQFKQVIDTLKSQGVKQTYRAVMKKLDAYSPLGYSSVGKVIGVGQGVSEFKEGDLVACGGLTASHAEIVCVPENLCVKLNQDVDLKQAAYNTLGAIAMQGVRQAELRLGEACAVIGLGLLGQLTCLLLRASGILVIGVDVDKRAVKIAEENCADLAFSRDSDGIKEKINNSTKALGCDAVIITAATDSLDPINFAGAISRKKGTIVVVGAVPTGFDREPHFYKKELQVKMSCSYGPGRYDPQYEEKGIDYPPAYVRWTEKRNMEAFQELIYAKKIDVSYLTTHVFKLQDAPKAYDMMMERSEPFIGILIEYDPQITQISQRRIQLKTKDSTFKIDNVGIGFIGAGSYAQSHLLPNIPKSDKVVLKGVMTSSGTSSRSVAERYGFEFCTSDEKDIFENDEINTVFIATRHDSHAEFVLKALKAGKNVFVEKPLCLKIEELEEIASTYNSKSSIQNSKLPLLMVGYNRRFSPLAKKIKQAMGSAPMAMIYRVNAGSIPADSWIQDRDIGGGRIIGEVCHFIDFLTYLNGSLPISVSANAMADPNNLGDTLQISLSYQNGSIASISYFANGDKSVPKERVEIFANGCTAILNDFKELSIFSKGRKKRTKLMAQDKGQKMEVNEFFRAILENPTSVISFDEIYNNSLLSFKIIDSIRDVSTIRI